jgi:CRP/FNR family transcriptional regulator, cyclic AMP receptor protein
MIALETSSFTRRYKPGQTIIYPGDAADWLLQLEGGLIRILKISASGKTSTLRLVRPGDFFGEEHLTNDLHENEASALSEATVRSVNPAKMTTSEQRAVSISLAEQLGRSMKHSYHIRNRELRHRVAWYVLELLHSAVGGMDQTRGMFVYTSHQLIGEGIGAARESVSNTIMTLAREGILRSGYRQLVNIDAQALGDIVRSTSDIDIVRSTSDIGGDVFYPAGSTVNQNPQTRETIAISRYPNFGSSSPGGDARHR